MKILLIISNEDLRTYLLSSLRNKGYTCKAAERGSTGVLLAEEFADIDVILLDVQLSDLTPESVLKQVRNLEHKPIIISILAEKEVSKIVSYYKLGMDDYLVSPIDIDLLTATIEKRYAAQKDQSTTNESITIDNLVIDQQKITVTRDNEEISLTPKEFELLTYLTINQGIVISREQILGAVWGQDPDVDTRVVDVYIGYLRKKIDTPKQTPLIHTIRGFGYTLKPAESS